MQFETNKIPTEKPWLLDTIDFAADIEPYRLTSIYSGVGSGKNYFVEQFIKGNIDKNIPKKTILIITSRRAKVDEVLTEEDIDISQKVGKWGNMHKVINEADNPEKYNDFKRTIKTSDKEYSIFQKSVVCTNAFIEAYLQYQYNPNDITTHLWELFDIIVVDEVHSLVSDSSYQSAPYYVNELIKETLKRHKLADENDSREKSERNPSTRRPLCKNIILMTGSPAPLEKLTLFSDVNNVIDRLDICKNVMPNNVFFVTYENSRRQIAEDIAKGERIIYFANKVTMPKDFDKQNRIPLDKITISFSKEEIRKELKRDTSSDSLYKKMEKTEDSLKTHGLIPAEYSLFLTTSRNKEGINITDNNVQHVYVEAHNISDIIQMAGRVRVGIENFHIIVDSYDHPDNEWENEASFSLNELAPNMNLSIERRRPVDTYSLNKYLLRLCSHAEIDLFANPRAQTKSRDIRSISNYIQYVHKTFPYVRYDYFKNHFCFYYMRFYGMMYQTLQQGTYQHAQRNFNEFEKMIQSIFPKAVVHPYKDKRTLMKEYMDNLLKDNPRRMFSLEEDKKILEDLNDIYCSGNQKRYNSLGSLLSQIDLKRIHATNKKESENYYKYRYVPRG